jgi:peptidoglycan hydrolase-like protein with peptidoglycan-binding domain
MAPYLVPGLILQRGVASDPNVVCALQRDLRALGYLKSSVDGAFGPATEAAIRSLQFDLLHNTGSASDGLAPVAVRDYNRNSAVQKVDGVLNQAVASCIAAMLSDPKFPTLPNSANPASDNAKALSQILGMRSTVVPAAFVAAALKQESGGRHFCVPAQRDTDNFIVVGLDRNSRSTDQITSRGFGIGQYTLFHHPPRPDEVQDFMMDPVRNVQKAQIALRAKFDSFVVGPADTADDRKAEHPLLPMRLCRYATNDQRYLSDCARCARSVGTVNISAGAPVFAGSSTLYAPTQYYRSANYSHVPNRAEFLCDWPYAVRRYNGSGVNSFHYQALVLLDLVAQPMQAEAS